LDFVYFYIRIFPINHFFMPHFVANSAMKSIGSVRDEEKCRAINPRTNSEMTGTVKIE